jgi:hypothetical protein
MGWACSTNEEERNAYRLLVRKPEGKRPLRIPRCRYVDNIRTDLGEVEWGSVDWIGLALALALRPTVSRSVRLVVEDTCRPMT